MTPFTLARALLEDNFDYATTDIRLEDHLADFIIDWGRLQIPDDVLTDSGREDHIHVTVKYGLVARELPPELKEIAQTTKPFPIFMGVISLFTTNPKFDVVKIDVESPELRRLNKRISAAIHCEDTYPEYHPHVTVAYVQKGTCDHLDGEDPFQAEEIPREFIAYGLAFRPPGDETDPKRTEQMLLFSKTAKPDHAMAMAEADSRDNTLLHTVQEADVIAISMVESWRRQGLTRAEMIQRLREGRWPAGMKYWHNRRSLPEAYNRLVRQTLACIKESSEGELIVNLDPFAGIGFPVDPDRTKFFLRSRSVRHDGRTIL